MFDGTMFQSNRDQERKHSVCVMFLIRTNQLYLSTIS